MSIPYEFVDLNENRLNISGHVIQPSDVQPQTAHSSTNEVSLTSQKQNPQGKQPVPKGFTTHPTLDNLNQLPNPKLHDEKSKSEVPATTTDQARKTFTKGPSVLLTDEANAKEFGVDLKKNTSQETFDVPSNRYTPGMVKSTGDRALVDMVNDLPNLIEESGCIVDKTCVPGPDCYKENVHFVRRKCLGRGSFGEVSLCEDKITQKLFVIKQVSKNKLRSSEIIVPSKLNHLNLTKFYGLIQRYYGKDKGNPTMELLLEYCGLAINKYYDQFGLLTDAQKWEVSKQGCAGLDHMSSNNIVHLDIKPENICIDVWADGSVVVKLTDFGSSRRRLEEPLKFVGLTPGYLAPEVCKILLQRQLVRNFGLSEENITGKVDTFAFGLVIMFLYKGYHILVKYFKDGKQSLSQQIKLMADSRTEFVHDLIPDECDLKMKILLRDLTRLNHRNRFNAQQALCYIEEIAKDRMESENDPVEKRTKGAPGMELNPFKKCLSITEGNAPISLNNVSPQAHQMSGFTCIRPTVRKTRANNSLGGKATIKPEVSLKMPQKLAKEQEMEKQPAPIVQQELRQKRVKEEAKFLTGQAKKMKTNSPLQMDMQKENIKEEEEESKGSALPNLRMLLSNTFDLK